MRNALHCNALQSGLHMAEASERMKAMRERRRAQGLRELRLIVPDARSPLVRRRIARQVAKLDPGAEAAAMRWIEAVSEFDTE
jgi:Protein  of unknown function (DUF3018)